MAAKILSYEDINPQHISSQLLVRFPPMKTVTTLHNNNECYFYPLVVDPGDGCIGWLRDLEQHMKQSHPEIERGEKTLFSPLSTVKGQHTIKASINVDASGNPIVSIISADGHRGSFVEIIPDTQIIPIVQIDGIKPVYEDFFYINIVIKEITICPIPLSDLIPKMNITTPMSDIPPQIIKLSPEEIVNNNDLENSGITLIAPNRVYLDTYLERIRTAKHYKSMAINAMIEAKKIKKMYMIHDIRDSDSEFEADMNELSDAEYY